MSDERFKEGWEKLTSIHGNRGEAVLASLGPIAPDLAKYIIEFAFGDIYRRPGLDMRQRQLVTITALATLGDCEKELRVHLHASLKVGLRPEEIVEALIQCAVYAGFPRALNAVSVAKDVFAERGIRLQDGAFTTGGSEVAAAPASGEGNRAG